MTGTTALLDSVPKGTNAADQRPRPPAWRDPARLRAEARRRRQRPILLALSLLCLSLLALPPDRAYDEAISFQLARGAPTAWALFVAMGATLGYLAVRLWGWKSRLGAVAAGLVILGLRLIALTNPYSDAHLSAFETMCVAVLLGHAGLFYVHLDPRLLVTAVLAALAVVLCFGHLGLGERLLVASSLVALNLLVYGHLDP